MNIQEEPKVDWIIESNNKLLNRLVASIGLLGVIFIFLTRNRVEESNSIFWGYWLGVLLTSVAIGVLVFFERTVIRVDRAHRLLVVQKKGFLGERNFALPFDQVESVHVASIGRRHRGLVTHHLILRLKSGKKEVPGRFSTDASEIFEISQKLAEEIGCRNYGP